MSPATVLEHEAAQALNSLIDPSKHLNDSKPNGSVYGDKEEQRVITQVESRQAYLNGEFPANYVRPDHYSSTVRVNTPITNGIIRWQPLWFMFTHSKKYKY